MSQMHQVQMSNSNRVKLAPFVSKVQIFPRSLSPQSFPPSLLGIFYGVGLVRLEIMYQWWHIYCNCCYNNYWLFIIIQKLFIFCLFVYSFFTVESEYFYSFIVNFQSNIVLKTIIKLYWKPLFLFLLCRK